MRGYGERKGGIITSKITNIYTETNLGRWTNNKKTQLTITKIENQQIHANSAHLERIIK